MKRQAKYEKIDFSEQCYNEDKARENGFLRTMEMKP
jgi:hypothetical protein